MYTHTFTHTCIANVHTNVVHFTFVGVPTNRIPKQTNNVFSWQWRAVPFLSLTLFCCQSVVNVFFCTVPYLCAIQLIVYYQLSESFSKISSIPPAATCLCRSTVGRQMSITELNCAHFFPLVRRSPQNFISNQVLLKPAGPVKISIQLQPLYLSLLGSCLHT